jgi:hypothetical protein
MLLIHEYVSVPRVAIVHIDNSLICILQRPLLNEGVDFVLSSECQHLSNVRWRSDSRSTKFDAFHDKGKCVLKQVSNREIGESVEGELGARCCEL